MPMTSSSRSSAAIAYSQERLSGSSDRPGKRHESGARRQLRDKTLKLERPDQVCTKQARRPPALRVGCHLGPHLHRVEQAQRGLIQNSIDLGEEGSQLLVIPRV